MAAAPGTTLSYGWGRHSKINVDDMRYECTNRLTRQWMLQLLLRAPCFIRDCNVGTSTAGTTVYSLSICHLRGLHSAATNSRFVCVLVQKIRI